FGEVWTINELPFFNFENPASTFNYTTILLVISYTSFARRYLETYKYCPRWDRVIMGLYKFGILCSLILLLYRNELAFRLMYGYHFLSIIQFIIAGWLTYGMDK